MVQLRFAILLLALVQSALGAGHVKKAYAYFDGRGVVGRISFEDDGSKVLITTSFTSLPDNTGLGYHVHNWPVEYTQDPSIRCDEVGGHYDPSGKQLKFGDNYSTECMNNSAECEIGDLAGKHGKLVKGNNMYNDTYGLSLSDSTSIVFRSIVIHNATNSTRLTCATILPETANTLLTARARFNGPKVGGSIWFFQPSSNAKDTYIHSDLFFTDSGAEAKYYGWWIYNSPAGTAGRRGECAGIGETRFTTRTEPVTCDATDASTCHEYDLTTKHGNLTIWNARNRKSFSEYDGITLSGDNSITGLSIGLSLWGNVVACASIKKTSFIRAKAEFTTYSIYAIEYSPFLPSHIKYTREPTDITRHAIYTEGYYSGRVCDSSLLVYSPFTTFTPGAGVNTTQDFYETGNLSNVLTATWVWHNTLPLSGPYSTLGRTASVVNGGTWECVEWQDDFFYRIDESFIYRARAVFAPSPCWVSLSQRVSSDIYEPETNTPMNLPDFDTGEVTIFDYCPNGNPSRSYSIQTAEATRYSPYWVQSAATNSSEYDTDCMKFRAERCEVGDLKRLNFTRWTDIHTNLELLGRYRVTGQYLRMYTTDGSVDMKAEIVPLYSKGFTACISSCEVANARSYTVTNVHTLVDVTCMLASETSNCDSGEYQVDGRVTGGSASEAEQNLVTISQVFSAGYHLRATFIFTFLSFVLLSLLYMY